MLNKKIISLAALACGLSTAVFVGCSKPEPVEPGVPFAKVTDALHMVLNNDRTVYTKQIIGRLVKKEKVLKASEHFMDEKAAPLPAQIFRMGAEMTAEKNAFFSYSLQSLWPINKSNAANQTEEEIKGLKFVADNGGTAPYYGEEMLGGQKYFMGVYADVASSPVCVDCHNDHKDSPKTDFKLNDVMGAVVIRIPYDS